MQAPLRCALKDAWRKSLETFPKVLCTTAFTIWMRKGPNQQNTRHHKCGNKTITGEWGDGFARSASHCVAEWWGCEPHAKQFRAHTHTQNVVKELFFSPLHSCCVFFFFQKYHFNQSFDNYETCQPIARIHQMCHKWQEMRRQILKLDGLQKSPTITAINHPGTSISGWRKFCREQRRETKAHAEERCHAVDGKGWPSIAGLSLELQRLQLCWDLRDTTHPHLCDENTQRSPLVQQETQGSKTSPMIFLGSTLALPREL